MTQKKSLSVSLAKSHNFTPMDDGFQQRATSG